jgi:hypothetical protein
MTDNPKMSADPAPSLLHALETWGQRYHAERAQLTVGELDELRVLLARLAEQIERDATGPSTVPQSLPEDRQ